MQMNSIFECRFSKWVKTKQNKSDVQLWLSKIMKIEKKELEFISPVDNIKERPEIINKTSNSLKKSISE